MPTLTADTQFDELVQEFPSTLHDLAYEHGAFQRARKITSPAQLLRLVLGYCGLDWSARDLAAQHTLLTGESITDEAMRSRLKGCGPWIAALLRRTLKLPAQDALAGVGRLLVADGTTAHSPAPKGIDHRLHLCLDLRRLQLQDALVTDAHTGESLEWFALQPGDLILGDGGLARVPQLSRVRQLGAHPLVRINHYSVCAFDLEGNRIDWVQTVADQLPGSIDSHRVVLRSADGKSEVEGFVHALRLTDVEAARARRLLHARNPKRTPKHETVVLAGWLLIFTTLEASVLSGQTVFALYRCRWQVELAIKKLKSLLDIASVRARRQSPLAEVWLQGKLLYAVLIERRARRFGSATARDLDTQRDGTRWRVWKLVIEQVRPLISGVAFWKPEAMAKAVDQLSERSRRRKLQQLPPELAQIWPLPTTAESSIPGIP